MATDQTEVPVGKVIGIGVFALTTIVGIHISIWGYYYSMYGDEQHRKGAGTPSSVLTAEREDEARRLAGIHGAMEQVARSVTNESRPSGIAPRASSDLQALQGWGLRPRIVPNPPPARGDTPAGADTTTPPPAAPAPAVAPTIGGPVAPAQPVAPAAAPAAPVVNGSAMHPTAMRAHP